MFLPVASRRRRRNIDGLTSPQAPRGSRKELRNVNAALRLSISRALEARFLPIIEKQCDFIDSDLLPGQLINNGSLFQDRMGSRGGPVSRSLFFLSFLLRLSSSRAPFVPSSRPSPPPAPSPRLLHLRGASIDKWGAEAPVSPEGGSRMGIAHSVSARAISGVFLLALFVGSPLTRYESEEAGPENNASILTTARTGNREFVSPYRLFRRAPN